MKLAERKHLTNNRSSAQPRRSMLSVKSLFTNFLVTLFLQWSEIGLFEQVININQRQIAISFVLPVFS